MIFWQSIKAAAIETQLTSNNSSAVVKSKE
jgi:hypothetical protein